MSSVALTLVDRPVPVVGGSAEQIARDAFARGALPGELWNLVRIANGEPATELVLHVGANRALRLALVRVANCWRGSRVAPFRSFEDVLDRSHPEDVASVVLGLVLGRRLLREPELIRRRVWAHTLRTAFVAGAIAGMDDLLTPLQGMLTGAVHDLGILALLAADIEGYDELVRCTGPTLDGLQNLERSRLGVYHPEVGVAIATQLEAPLHVTAAIGAHHASSRVLRACRTLRIAEEIDLQYVVLGHPEEAAMAVAGSEEMGIHTARWLVGRTVRAYSLAGTLLRALGGSGAA